MKKRLYILTIAVSLTLSLMLTGCSNNTGKETTESSTNTESTKTSTEDKTKDDTIYLLKGTDISEIETLLGKTKSDKVDCSEVKVNTYGEYAVNVTSSGKTETYKVKVVIKSEAESLRNKGNTVVGLIVAENTTSKASVNTETVKEDVTSDKNKSSDADKTKKETKTDSESTSKQESKEQTGCTHNWVAQKKTVHHDAVTHQEWVTNKVYVEDSAEWWEPCYRTYCATCGAWDCGYGHTCPGGEEISEMESELYHPATGHYEDQGSYQTVTDKAAYDEQMITGYTCSKCGATR